ncbi:hypothetical protein E3P99_01320 [Wallemia hederae]|uniref:RNase III domain-containing protein n=1 Tax=Wallemia hederae TaxID=1540922 RepID=A0A4T0FRL2_9BASI|nr:hypothetical protein E3P99_01320 [Wallemia hederae]
MKSSQTPLRRVSSGALTNSHNGSVNHKQVTQQHPLEFLTPALSDLSDELDGIVSSTHQLVELDQSLADFNHGFGSLLWALKLNAYCINWPEAPTDESFARVQELNDRLQQSLAPPREPTPPPQVPETNPADETYRTAQEDQESTPKPPPKAPPKTKPKVVSVQLRKKREAFVDSVIESLPLEYRGSQPALRNAMASVLHALMKHQCTTPDGSGIRVPDLVKQPELPQAKVNKCLIALVQKKAVLKWTESGVAYYRLQLDTPRQMSEPNKSSGIYHSVKGNVVESVGTVTGSEEWKKSGQKEHVDGEAEQKAAQIKNTAEGIYDQVAGRVQNVKAAVTGDKSGQVDAVAQEESVLAAARAEIGPARRESSGTPATPVTPPDEPPIDSNESPKSPPSPSPTPILPANYPPPLPHISRELRDLTFTHKSCAELAAAFNAAKLGEIHTVTYGEAGETASSHVKPFAPVYDNEVSEFVGDSILSAVVSLLLRQWYPHLRPDGLTEIRSKLVNRTRLAHWAELYHFEKHLIVPPHLAQLQVRTSPIVLSGAFEAYVASVYDQAGDDDGFRAVKQWLDPLCRPYADVYSASITSREKELRETPKLGSLSFLNQMVDKYGILAQWSESGGPSISMQHYWKQTLTLTVNPDATGSDITPKHKLPLTTTGLAPKKKVAKEMAAYKALKELSLR